MSRRTPPLIPIRELRRAYGLTAKQLAERIADQGVRVSENTITNIERGWQSGSEALMIAWAHALRIHPLDVHSEQGERNTPVLADLESA